MLTCEPNQNVHSLHKIMACMMYYWLAVVAPAAFFLSDLTLCDLSSDKQGPYEIHMKYLEDCANPATALIKTYTKTKKATRTTVVVEGTAVFNVTFDNNIKILMNFGQSTSQGWKDNFVITDFNKKGVCDVMAECLKPEDSLKVYQGLISGKKNFSSCPIDSGMYIVDGINIKVDEFKGFPLFFYGKYRAKVSMFMNDYSSPEIGCLIFYVDFVPKVKKGKNRG